MKEALSSSGTSVLTRARRRNIPEDTTLHSHRRENLKSYMGPQSVKAFQTADQHTAQNIPWMDGPCTRLSSAGCQALRTGHDEEYGLLRYGTAQFGEGRAFRPDVPVATRFYCFLAWFLLSPRRWSRYGSPNRWVSPQMSTAMMYLPGACSSGRRGHWLTPRLVSDAVENTNFAILQGRE
jgi:hypothetical protein